MTKRTADELMARADAIYRLLEQDAVWVDKDGVPHKIDEMDDSYVFNVIAFLRRRAQFLAFHHGLGMAHDPIFADAPPCVDQSMDEEWDRQLEDPEEWLDDTPLMRKLLSRHLGAFA